MPLKKLLAVVLATGMGIAVAPVAFAATGSENDSKPSAGSETQLATDLGVFYAKGSQVGRDRSLNEQWKFHLGEVKGAEAEQFNDYTWRDVTLPHDYSIEQKYTKNGEAESAYLPGGVGWYRRSLDIPASQKGQRFIINFDGAYMDAKVWVNGHYLGMHPYGYSPFSFDITDYVKPGEANEIAVRTENKIPSSRWYSGSGIYRNVSLTTTNPIHVQRYGNQILTPDLEQHLSDTSQVTVKVNTTVRNDSKEAVRVKTSYDVTSLGDSESIGNGESDEVEIPAGESKVVTGEFKVAHPKLWDVEHPNLYDVKTQVLIANKAVDVYHDEFGFRVAKFDPDRGFILNGKNIKLKGMAMHHDQGALGAAAYKRAIERQVEILQDMGANAIRVTHNPASEDLIRIANERGVLLIEEAFDTWYAVKNGNTYEYSRVAGNNVGSENKLLGADPNEKWTKYDLQQMVKRGRNAPAIIGWSLGNELTQDMSMVSGHSVSEYPRVAQEFIDWVKEVDPTRLSTFGDNKLFNANGGGINNEVAAVFGRNKALIGLNYKGAGAYNSYHQAYPEAIIYGSEVASHTYSRGYYKREASVSRTNDKLISSYNGSRASWGSAPDTQWRDVITNDYVAGSFAWTGFDYLGEPTPWNGVGPGSQGVWPAPKSSYFGVIDTAGLPKDAYYLYRSMWNTKDTTLNVLPVWNKNSIMVDSSGKVPVEVYTSAPEVELWVKAKGGEPEKVGTKKFKQYQTANGFKYQLTEGDNKFYATFKAPFKEGELYAVAKDENGNTIENTVGRSVVYTAGPAAKLAASTDRKQITADGNDLVYVHVKVLDADGHIVPDAENRVKFSVSGAGQLVGVDNGRQDDHQSYQDDNRRAFAGELVAIVRATHSGGPITITATSDGLESASVSLNAVNPVSKADGSDKVVDHYEANRLYYVKTGNKPNLPAKIKAIYADGHEEDVEVKWPEIDAKQYSRPQAFTVTGMAGDTEIKARIIVMDQFGAVLNYSTMTEVGTPAALPEKRPAVLANGQVLNIEVPVKWDNVPVEKWNEKGTLVIKGKAQLFGNEIPVTASVRVETKVRGIGENVARTATVTQNIPQGEQSDNITAVNDGHTGDGNANARWSNWKYSQNGHPEADLTFKLKEENTLTQATVFFQKDGPSLRYPDGNKTKLYVSETGEENSWKEVAVTEIQGTESGNVKPYTFKFAPVKARYVKLHVVNKNENLNNGKPSTGIVEVQLFKPSSQLPPMGTVAEFKSISVNEQALNNEEIASGSYDTSALKAEVEAEAKENGAITILPAYNGVLTVLVEAEDHSGVNAFRVHLDSQASEKDDARDVPRDETTVEVGNEASQEPATRAIDGKPGTVWHTDWNNVTPEDKRWIIVDIKKDQLIDGLRYLARTDNSNNGRVKKYRVEISSNKTDWKQVGEGSWEDQGGWRTVNFDPQTARYVRLTGVETYGDIPNKFMSAAEIRVRKAPVSLPLDNATFQANPESVKLTAKQLADAVYGATPKQVTVTLDGKQLREDVDYFLTYSDNTAFGKGKVTATGIKPYTGTVTLEYNIEKVDPELDKVEVASAPAKTAYKVGEKVDPEGLELKLVNNDGSETTVAYGDETAKDFTFTPALDKALTSEDKALEVTYQGKKVKVAELNVTATAPEVKPDPEKDKQPEVKPDPEKDKQPEGTPDPEKVVLKSEGVEVTAGAGSEAEPFAVKADPAKSLTLKAVLTFDSSKGKAKDATHKWEKKENGKWTEIKLNAGNGADLVTVKVPALTLTPAQVKEGGEFRVTSFIKGEQVGQLYFKVPAQTESSGTVINPSDQSGNQSDTKPSVKPESETSTPHVPGATGGQQDGAAKQTGTINGQVDSSKQGATTSNNGASDAEVVSAAKADRAAFVKTRQLSKTGAAGLPALFGACVLLVSGGVLIAVRRKRG